MNSIDETWNLDPSDADLPDDFVRRVATPALVIYLDRVRHNLRRVIELFGGDVERWRPHVKTTKIPAIFAEMARAGLRGFKCATVREAEHLSRALDHEGIVGSDVLVAYPLLGPGLDRLGRIAASRPETRFSILCEDPEALDRIPPALDVFVDVNSGMNRTGVPIDDRARILAIAVGAGVRFRGVHAYDGHLTQPDAEERRRAVFACYERLVDLVGFLTESRVRVAEVTTAGTPSLLAALEYRGFDAFDGVAHRLSPGTVVYHDLRSQEQCPALGLLPAAVVLSRVVSHPTEGIATCDAGSKSIAAEAGDPCAYVIGHPEWVPARPSEEHLPLRVRSGPLPPRGTTLFLVPRHVCPTVNLAEQAILVSGGEVREIAPVSARAHDLLVGNGARCL